jgi:hypothetical protein
MVVEPLKGVNPLFHQVYWLPIVWVNLQPLPQYSCCSSSLYQTQEILKQSYIILWVDWTAFSLSRIWHCGDPFLSKRGWPETIIWPACNSSAVVGADLPGSTVIGNNNFIGYNAVVEAKCQDLKYRLVSESVKAKQVQNSLLMEKQDMAKQL